MSSAEDRAADVRRLCAVWLPDLRADAIVELGRGLEHTAYEVDGSVVVRFADDPGGSVLAEAQVLAAVAARSPVPVPQVLFADAEACCLAYAKLAGTPLLDIAVERRAAAASQIAAALADTLLALHTLSEALSGVVELDDASLHEWQAEATELYGPLRETIPTARRPAVERFLASAPPPDATRLTFCHNDLGIEHVLVDPQTLDVTGIIDWSDAAIVDEASDLGLILRDLGPAAFEVAAQRLGDGPGLRDRAAFCARCSVLEDLAFGLGTGRAPYVEKCLASLAWLFPV